jgi:hypothetical protein
MRIPTTFTATFNPDPAAARGKLVMDTERFKRAMNNLDKLRKGKIDIHNTSEEFNAFVKEFNLQDPRTFWSRRLYTQRLTDSVMNINTGTS